MEDTSNVSIVYNSTTKQYTATAIRPSGQVLTANGATRVQALFELEILLRQPMPVQITFTPTYPTYPYPYPWWGIYPPFDAQPYTPEQPFPLTTDIYCAQDATVGMGRAGIGWSGYQTTEGKGPGVVGVAGSATGLGGSGINPMGNTNRPNSGGTGVSTTGIRYKG